MKKHALIAMALAAVTTVGTVGAAHADDTRFSLAVGPAWTSVDGLKGDTLSGVNLQYKFEWKESRVGLVGGFTHTGHSSSKYTIDGLPGSRVDADFSYTSFTVGPSFRFNKYVTLYGQVGVGQGEIEINDAQAPGYQVSYAEHDGETSLVYGIGAHLQPDRHLFLNLYYERGGMLVDTDTYSIGLGYMF